MKTEPGPTGNAPYNPLGEKKAPPPPAAPAKPVWRPVPSNPDYITDGTAIKRKGD